MKNIKKEIYALMDAFLTECKDQNGNERSLERLNQDRHLFVNGMMLEIQGMKEELLREPKRLYSDFVSVKDIEKFFDKITQ